MRHSKLVPLLSRPALDKFGSYPSIVLGLNPIAYWPLNDLSGATAVELVAGNNGTYTGVSLAQSQPPFVAPLFDGANDYCNIYSAGLVSAFNGQAGSLALWCKVSGAGVWADGASRYMATIYVDADNSLLIKKASAAGTLQILYKAGATTKTFTLGSLSTTGWFHYAFTWSLATNQAIAYYNGVAASPQTSLGTWAGNPAANQTLIGAYITTPSNIWSGWLVHPAIWDRALSDEEIYYLYLMAGA